MPLLEHVAHFRMSNLLRPEVQDVAFAGLIWAASSCVQGLAKLGLVRVALRKLGE